MSFFNNFFTRVFTHVRFLLFYRSIRLFIFGIITALIIIGCGNITTKNTPLNSVNVNSEITSEMRIVKHAMGETKVPINPKRVIVLGGLDHVLALGIKPIASTTLGDYKFPDYLENLASGIEKIGANGQPSLEKILYLKPDLILGFSWDAELYNQLSKIAPTVLADQNDTWKDWFKKYAEALGQTEKAETLLQEYDQKIENIRLKMGANIYKPISKPKISLVNFWANYTRLYMNDSFSGSILKEIGLPRPEYEDKDKTQENISLELIPKIGGDVIFLIIGGHNESRLKQFTNHPLWSQLNAVQQNRVYPVTGDTWVAGWGIIAANQVLDDLFKYLF